jgi:hypothetical protein
LHPINAAAVTVFDDIAPLSLNTLFNNSNTNKRIIPPIEIITSPDTDILDIADGDEPINLARLRDMIDLKEDIYLTKSDKLNDESNVSSWFAPFDSRGVVALRAMIGAIGTVIAIYTVTQSKRIRNLIATTTLATNIPLIEASPTLHTSNQFLVEEALITAGTQIAAIIVAYLVWRIIKLIYTRFKNMYMTVRLRRVSEYSGHTTGICIEAINYHCSLLIPLCSIKSHPIDLVTDGRVDLRVINYQGNASSTQLHLTSTTPH